MIKEVKKVEAVVVYNVDLRQWKGKVLKGNLNYLGVEFNKSKGALVIEANDNNVEEIVRLVKQGNYKYVVDTVIEYVEVEEAEEKEMEKYLLNLTDGRISKEGNGFGFEYVTVVGEEKEVEGGFAFIGTDANGNKVEAFLTIEEYFDGKEFVAGTKSPRTLIEEGKALEVEARKMDTVEAIETINTYLEEVGAVINKIEEDELRYELRDIENPLKWYVANLEEMVEAEEIETVEEAPTTGTKVLVVCLEGSKNFTRRMSYKGTVHEMKGHYRLTGDNGKSYIVKAERFGLRMKAPIEPRTENKAKLEALAREMGLVLGCYDKFLDTLSRGNIMYLRNNITKGVATDIIINHKLKKYVVSVNFVDNEIDFTSYTKEEYIAQFGEDLFLEY